MTYGSTFIYHSQDARPLLIELDREFIESPVAGAEYANCLYMWLIPLCRMSLRLGLCVSVIRGAAHLDYRTDTAINKLMVSKMTALDSIAFETLITDFDFADPVISTFSSLLASSDILCTKIWATFRRYFIINYLMPFLDVAREDATEMDILRSLGVIEIVAAWMQTSIERMFKGRPEQETM
jgi:hypothetical protein